MTITIPSGRTLPLQAKSGGGFQSNGLPNAEWSLASQYWAASRMTAQIVCPQPTASQSLASRYRYAHDAFDYIVPIAIQGGAAPFFGEISGVDGATVTRKSPSWNPEGYFWFEVKIPAATVSQWSAQQTITFDLYDQENTSSPAASVSWSVTKDNGKFTFVDAVNGSDANDGTLVADGGTGPLATIAGWYKSDQANTDFSNQVMVYRAGIYSLDAGLSASNGLYFIGNNKPVAHIAYPGESVLWQMGQQQYDNASGPIEDLYLDGIEFDGESNTNGLWLFWEPHLRATFFNCKFSNLVTGTQDNRGAICSPLSSAGHQYLAVINPVFDGFVSTSQNRASCFVFFDLLDSVFSGPTAINMGGALRLFYPKGDIVRVSILGCSNWQTDGSRDSEAYLLQNAGDTYASGQQRLECRYSRGFRATETGPLATLGDSNQDFGEVYFDRNTMVGEVRAFSANGSCFAQANTLVSTGTPLSAAVTQDGSLTPKNDLITSGFGSSALNADGFYPDGNANRYLYGAEIKGAN